MPRKSHTTEQIIGRLREAEVLLGQGQTVTDDCRSLKISEQTFYRWRKEYGGLRTDQAHRLKEMEKDNAQLRKLVTALSLNNDIWRETARRNGSARPGAGKR
jgi:transposase-like protein